MTPSRPLAALAPRLGTRLGVHLTGDGVDVAVLASHADQVELCLLDPDPEAADGWAETRVPLEGPMHGVWTAHVPGVRAGQRYGFRAHGRWDPGAGLRYNPAKLLLDPYARGIDGDVLLGPAVYGQRVGDDLRTLGAGWPAYNGGICPWLDRGGWSQRVLGRTLLPAGTV